MNIQSAARPLTDTVVASRRATVPASHKLPVFIVAVLALEAAVVALPLGGNVTPFVLVLIPAVAAIAVGWASGGRREVGALAGRLFVWRVNPWWYVAALGIPVAEKLTVDLVGTLLGFSTPGRLVGALSASALLVPVVVLLPALLEELGWRGFGVQAALEQGRSPAWAALVVGLIFLLLHVPLYLPGQLYDGLPLWPAPLILLASSVLLTWIYVGTSSALLAGLMHAALNASVPLTWGLDPAWVWQARAITLTLTSGLLIAIYIKKVRHTRVGPGWRSSSTHGKQGSLLWSGSEGSSPSPR
jgi:membrane protease YdiL (CAAX protease family)